MRKWWKKACRINARVAAQTFSASQSESRSGPVGRPTPLSLKIMSSVFPLTGSLVVDENALTDGQHLGSAREFYASRAGAIA
jgi:hypothetical protein